MSVESSMPAIEILARTKKSKRPIAFSMDPDRTSTERIRAIVRLQINNKEPKTIYANIGGVYDEIEASEFRNASMLSDSDQKDFVEEIVAVLKGPYTSDIIISVPLRRQSGR